MSFNPSRMESRGAQSARFYWAVRRRSVEAEGGLFVSQSVPGPHPGPLPMGEGVEKGTLLFRSGGEGGSPFFFFDECGAFADALAEIG
jgi:hypothetical protein